MSAQISRIRTRDALHARLVQREARLQKNVSEVKRLHELRRKIDDDMFYPAHDARTESPAYKKVHEHLCDELDLPCLVCGVRKSTLKNNAKNRFGARAMETHHHIIEWALANAVDVDKFNASLRPHLAHAHPHDPTWAYEKPFDQQKIKDWVDHSEHNLWVLCDVHHRHKLLGIHEVTYPTWCPQDLLQADIIDAIRKNSAAKAGAAKVPARGAPAARAAHPH